MTVSLVGFDFEEHEGSVIASTSEIKAGNQLRMRQAHETSSNQSCPRGTATAVSVPPDEVIE